MSILNTDPFAMILIIIPTIILVMSIILQIITKKKAIIITLVFFGCLVATFTIFNSSFLIWCFVYTIISFIGTTIGDFKKGLALRIILIVTILLGYILLIGYPIYQWNKIDEQIKVYPDKVDVTQ